MTAAQPYILLLEDDGNDRFITESIFKEKGYNVALEFLLNSEDVLPYLDGCIRGNKMLPGLIILDKNVPVGEGLDVLRSLKLHTQYRGIPVVMISGTAHEDDIKESYQSGVNSFITKPFTSADTARTIDTFVHYWFHIVDLPNLLD